MSYLNGTRITFSGRFLADVPTINNSPPAFDPRSGTPAPLWNPGGGGTFDFLACHVNGGERPDGESMAADDPARGLAVVGAGDRPAAKLVDLDPRWQFSSQIWALVVRLVDPESGEELLSGSFRVSAFRDVWRRQTVEGGNGQRSGASFVSVLDDVTFGPRAATSSALSAIRAESDANRLSIVLNTFGYHYQHVDGRHTTGSMTGCIGPWRTGEPAGFVAGRRIDAGLLARPGNDPILLAWSVASIDHSRSRVVVDLGNAYPVVDVDGTPATLADLTMPGEQMEALELAVLASEEVEAGAVLDDADGNDATEVIGTIELADAPARSGVYSFPLSPTAAEAIGDRPLALVVRRSDGTRRVVSRETTDGLYVRADAFVHRIDARGTGTATVHAVRRGVPAPGVTVHLAAADPTNSLVSPPTPVVTGAEGVVEITLTGAEPTGSPDAIDGEVVVIKYSPRLDNGVPDYAGTGLNPTLDAIVAHVRDAFDIADRPDWERDIEPIMTQYARLYPIMREHLVDLRNRDALQPWRAALLFAMTRPIDDPNYMPVTRDLSEPKRLAIVRWLEQLPEAQRNRRVDRRFIAAEPGVAGGEELASAPREVSAEVAAEVDAEVDAKSEAAADIGRRVAARQHRDPDGHE